MMLRAAKLLVLIVAFVAPLAVLGKDDSPNPRIIKDALMQNGNFYYVKGTVYNPSDRGLKNVVINTTFGRSGWGLMGTEAQSGTRVAWSQRSLSIYPLSRVLTSKL